MWSTALASGLSLLGEARSYYCANRTSDIVLVSLVSGWVGFCCGVFIAALFLSPSLRHILITLLLTSLQTAEQLERVRQTPAQPSAAAEQQGGAQRRSVGPRPLLESSS